MRHPGHLYLTGYRGSGKTTVAKQLALALGVDWIDLDDEIEQAAGKTIRDIFAEETEDGFRDRETAALREIAARPVAIVALGGGAILRESNRETIRESGRCVWLDADHETLAQRIGQDASSGQRRPGLTGGNAVDEVQQLLAQRRPLYEQASDFRVDTTGKSVTDIAEAILDWLDEQMETQRR